MQAWAVDQFGGGYTKAKDLTNALDAIRWGADYLVSAHSAPNQFVAVVGNSTLDFNYYGARRLHDPNTSPDSSRPFTLLAPSTFSSCTEHCLLQFQLQCCSSVLERRHALSRHLARKYRARW